MTAAPRALARAALGARARLRWVHLLLGGALLMPYYLLATVLLSFLVKPHMHPADVVVFQASSLLVAVPLAALSALLSRLVRPLEGAAARALTAPDGELATGPAGTWAERVRPALYFTLHVLLGGIVSGMSLAAPPAAVGLIVLPLTGHGKTLLKLAWARWADGPWLPVLGPLTGLALLALLIGTAWTAGTVLARCAPRLLGPSPADRLAEAEHRAHQLALRNRLARELHDSVGHALSAVLLQAGAARTVLATDPEFAREALAAIEQTTREAVGELDTVLGLLREEDGAASAAPAPTLADLDGLLARTRAAGGTVTLTAGGRPLEQVPPVVSREAYRIVQEGLGNALRHAGPVPVELRIDVDDDNLEVTVDNPLGTGSAARRAGGGRGLAGIAERARLLRGSATAERRDDGWRLSVRLPLQGAGR
ncbi:sensor histidine kinase [Streptomyces sp. NPDC052396]|uniref:sensor histidine kinase n=1 Tax=Streptomyces sp. NPDC052396 TaxID=3365689 RepID=UPI0037D6FDD3